MARTLLLNFNGAEIPITPERVDRKKLYGWNEKLALDDNGDVCKLASMDESGTVIIPPKGTGLGVISMAGDWVEKSTLIAMRSDGTAAEKVPSSYTRLIELSEIATPEEYLSHTIIAFYQLGDIDPALMAALKDTIYAFEYNYSDAYDTQRAFLLANAEGAFMMVCTKNEFEMLSLDEVGVVDDEEEDDEEEASDELDFSSF
jgi:hypothetical protein